MVHYLEQHQINFPDNQSGKPIQSSQSQQPTLPRMLFYLIFGKNVIAETSLPPKTWREKKYKSINKIQTWCSLKKGGGGGFADKYGK